jgi:hypothetical protein
LTTGTGSSFQLSCRSRTLVAAATFTLWAGHNQGGSSILLLRIQCLVSTHSQCHCLGNREEEATRRGFLCLSSLTDDLTFTPLHCTHPHV